MCIVFLFVFMGQAAFNKSDDADDDNETEINSRDSTISPQSV